MILINGMEDFVLLELKSWHRVKIQCRWDYTQMFGFSKPPLHVLGVAPICPHS